MTLFVKRQTFHAAQPDFPGTDNAFSTGGSGGGGGELRLSGNHAVTEYEMSGEQSNSGWLNNSNERIFQVMTFK